MTRSQQREQAFILLFEYLFFEKDLTKEDVVALFHENYEAVSDFARDTFYGVQNHLETIDEIISRYLNGWKISRLPKVTLSVLRLAVYEMSYTDTVPENVSINEAVELAKKYATQNDAAYINGVLGAYSRGRKECT